MKSEMELVAGEVQPLPMDEERGDVAWTDTNASRSIVRMISDTIVHDAVRKGVPVATLDISVGMATTMLAVAKMCCRFRVGPDLNDLVEAMQAMIEDARAVLDRGLALHSRDTLGCGVVMMEITCRGICAALSIPYEEVLRAVHFGSGDIRAILAAHGLIDLQGGANE